MTAIVEPVMPSATPPPTPATAAASVTGLPRDDTPAPRSTRDRSPRVSLPDKPRRPRAERQAPPPRPPSATREIAIVERRHERVERTIEQRLLGLRDAPAPPPAAPLAPARGAAAVAHPAPPPPSRRAAFAAPRAPLARHVPAVPVSLRQEPPLPAPVEIHIGRIELRASVAPQPGRTTRQGTPAAVPLEDYLRRRDGG